MKKIFFFVFALLLTQLSWAQWEDDFRLTDTYDTSFLNYGKSHAIATNGDTVHIVWYEKIDENWEIFYLRSTDGGNNWDWETRITNTEAYSMYPSVSLSGSSVYLIWAEVIDGNLEICFKRSLDSGENWDEDVRLTPNLQNSHGGVMSSSGSNVHVAWITSNADQQTWRVYYKNSTDGGVNWSSEFCASPNTLIAYNVSIAASGPNVHLAWNDQGDGNLEIYYMKSSDNGMSWEPEMRLTNDPAASLLPSIAASGTAVNVAWQDSRNGSYDVFFKGSIDGGESWGEDVQVTYDQGSSISPNLAMAGDALHLVWQDTRSGFYDVYYNYSIDGGNTWLEEIQLNDFSFSSQRPFIAASGPALHAIWFDYRDFNYEIYYKRNPTGGMVGVEEQLRAESFGLRVYPNPACQQLTVDSWQSAVGGRRSSVKLSIFDLFGQEIKEYEEILSYPIQLDISGLPYGVYILRMTDEEGNEEAVKFMKIKE